MSTGAGNTPSFGPSKAERPTRQQLQDVAKGTIKAIPTIMKSLEEEEFMAPRQSVLYDDTEEICPALSPENPYFPAHWNTKINVIMEDTLDAALYITKSGQYGNTEDDSPVCILNFANQSNVGGGFYSGALAQEEDLCRRSTLVETLHPHFYPMADDECIYSPSVVIFRENSRKNHAFMWTDSPKLLPEVSCISIAAERGPKLDPFKKQYASKQSRDLMQRKMRLILRVAANNHHRRLVLGALGCGVFGHPAQGSAELWLEVLREEEFGGWFEVVVFAIWDPNPPQTNYNTFQGILSGRDVVVPPTKGPVVPPTEGPVEVGGPGGSRALSPGVVEIIPTDPPYPPIDPELGVIDPALLDPALGGSS